MKHSKRNAAIGLVVMKVGVPIAKRYMRKRSRAAAANAAQRVSRNPAGTSVVVGAVLGGLAWAFTRSKGDTGDERIVRGDTAES